MTVAELTAAEDKIKALAEPLSNEEQKILYLFLYQMNHRVLDSQLFVSDILRKGK